MITMDLSEKTALPKLCLLFFFSPAGKKFRSKVQLAKHLQETGSTVNIEEFNFSRTTTTNSPMCKAKVRSGQQDNAKINQAKQLEKLERKLEREKKKVVAKEKKLRKIEAKKKKVKSKQKSSKEPSKSKVASPSKNTGSSLLIVKFSFKAKKKLDLDLSNFNDTYNQAHDDESMGENEDCSSPHKELNTDIDGVTPVKHKHDGGKAVGDDFAINNSPHKADTNSVSDENVQKLDSPHVSMTSPKVKTPTKRVRKPSMKLVSAIADKPQVKKRRLSDKHADQSPTTSHPKKRKNLKTLAHLKSQTNLSNLETSVVEPSANIDVKSSIKQSPLKSRTLSDHSENATRNVNKLSWTPPRCALPSNGSTIERVKPLSSTPPKHKSPFKSSSPRAQLSPKCTPSKTHLPLTGTPPRGESPPTIITRSTPEHTSIKIIRRKSKDTCATVVPRRSLAKYSPTLTHGSKYKTSLSEAASTLASPLSDVCVNKKTPKFIHTQMTSKGIQKYHSESKDEVVKPSACAAVDVEEPVLMTNWGTDLMI